MAYLLGLDAGNTKTIALVARADGTVLGAGRAGCGDIYGAGSPGAALAEVERAVAQALDAASLRPSDLAAGAFSMAGADWPEDFALLEGALRARGLGRTVAVYNDAIGALRAGSPDGTGVVVACGTGAAIGARSADGRIWHTSFWQEPQAAGELAARALRAVYRAELGIDPPTALTGRVLQYFGLTTVEAVLHAMTARGRARPPGVHGLARVLLDTAEEGDPTARRIVLAHGTALGDYALVAARKVGLAGQDFTLVLAGGIFRHPAPVLREALVARVREGAPGARPVSARLEPAAGALLLALEQAGTTVGEALLARLEATLPPPAFFAT
ncbi:MAG TPA: BadF/BadG/BcrA/BcrD ATPase family protein [Roseiflexaceae bacterium]|nr:BadF/BadG/BcrA/BcrD ATPase family protein [Roseiflexaceae bacterium]